MLTPKSIRIRSGLVLGAIRASVHQRMDADRRTALPALSSWSTVFARQMRSRCPQKMARCGFGETPVLLTWHQGRKQPLHREPLATNGTRTWTTDRPAGLIRLSSATIDVGGQYLLDYGSSYGSGTPTHHLTLYRHASGALVFGAGTVEWSFSLDANHDANYVTVPVNVNIQQATANLLADMTVQPATPQSYLFPASASTDTGAPTSTIIPPTTGSIPQYSLVTISGTATDTGGGVVGGVEVSVNGGTTWHPASGRANWSYTWTSGASGSVTIKSRAVDDSGNLETPGAGVTVTVNSGIPPTGCTGNTIWPATATPAFAATNDTVAVELGVRFRPNENGFICGLRFYKGSGNTGTHVGNLWSSAGTKLATATFANETATGWQQVNFANPVAVTASTVYVASYYAPVGQYARNNSYFVGTNGVTNGPLYALYDGESGGGNGVFQYGTGGGFPSNTFASTNYWVDVVFTTSAGSDTTPPTVTGRSPASGASGVAPTTPVTATFSEAMNAATVTGTTFQLLNGSTPVSATVSYNAANNTATLTPSNPLAASTLYTATVKGGTVTHGSRIWPATPWPSMPAGPSPRRRPM